MTVMLKTLNLKIIRLDGGTQMRATIDQATVEDYAEVLAAGGTLPPVTVFHDGAEFWLGGGFHRYHAHAKAGRASIAADVRKGTQRDAMLFAAGDNHDHGLRRTNADKRKAVLALLDDPEWQQWSDRAVAEACHVSDKTVGKLRAELSLANADADQVRISAPEATDDTPPRKVIGRDGKTQSVDGKRGKKAEAPPPKPAGKPAEPPADDNPDVPSADEAAAELRAELDRAERHATELERVIQTDDAKAKFVELVKRLEAAERARDDRMDEAARWQRKCEYWQRQLQRCGKLLGVKDLDAIARTVEKFVRDHQRVAA